MKYIKMLKDNRVNIIMVFDGMANLSKAGTEKKRRESRSQAKNRARELMIAGKTEEARKEFSKAVEINHEHALALMEACRKENIDCITSMYEADAQLAYLNKIGVVDYVISEDSDLILFGCTKIVFKLQLDGSCLLYDSKKLHATLGLSPERFSFEKFRRIAILSGCDYLDSLPGIGLQKASKFMLMTAETDMARALPKLPSYLNMMNKLTVTEEYIEGFLKAEATFKYMYVYDPMKRRMVRLNEFVNEAEEIQHCSKAGQEIDEDLAYQLALGNINPRTLVEVANFSPKQTSTAFYNKNASIIWKSDFEQKQPQPTKPLQQNKIAGYKPICPMNNKRFNEFQSQEEDVERALGIYYLIDTYSNSDNNQNQEQQPCTSKSLSNEGPSTSKNPFAKRTTEPEQSPDASKTSLIKNVASKEYPKVFSRFFLRQEPKPEPVLTEEMKIEAKRQLEIRLARNLEYYQMTKYRHLKPEDLKEVKALTPDAMTKPTPVRPEDRKKAVKIEKAPVTIEIDDDDFDFDSEVMREIEKLEKMATSSTSGYKAPGLKRKASGSNLIETMSQSKLAKYGFGPKISS